MQYMRLLLLTLALPPLANAQGVESLRWMSGSWAGSVRGVDMEEHWLEPKGGTLMGVHRDVARDRTVMFEFLRIESRPDGVFYLASPMGRAPTPFKLVESGPTRAVFENKEHDFPQRILYWLESGDLHARIEGPQGGKNVSEEWSWKKVK